MSQAEQVHFYVLGAKQAEVRAAMHPYGLAYVGGLAPCWPRGWSGMMLLHLWRPRKGKVRDLT